MKKLLKGIIDFRQNVRPAYREQFAALEFGQKPDTLMIACSDSRVAPNVFASTDPGDLFVVRNVGNLVPPYGAADASAEAAALEFSLANLPIKDIILCGHSNCGAMNALIAGTGCQHLPAVWSWLQFGQPALNRLIETKVAGESTARADALSKLNVLEQIEHLKTYPNVRERIENGTLRLHAWWFHIGDAEVLVHTGKEDSEFEVIDETFAQNWLAKADEPVVLPTETASGKFGLSGGGRAAQNKALQA